MDRFTSLERLSSPHSSVPEAGAGDVQSLSLASTDEEAALADTPLKARVSSYDGDHKSYMKGQATCRAIGSMFWREIHTGLQAPHNTLAERTFPPSAFTGANDLSFTRVVSKMTDVYSRKWVFKLDHREKTYARWLNRIGESFSQVTGIPVLREWRADKCNAPVLGGSPATGPLKCKPDIILVDANFSFDPTWPLIHAFGEITKQNKFHPEMEQTVYTKSHVMFSTQESRRFVCSLALYGECDRHIRLSVIDREGVLYQKIPFDGGFDNASRLIRIVAGFMCGSAAALGYDPTVQLKPDGSVDTITVTDPVPRTYCVVKKLHVATGIIGRCTRVWQAYDLDNPRKPVIIKDAWPLVSRRDLEEKALQRLQGIPGIPVIEQIATVKLARRPGGGLHEDSTTEVRRFALNPSPKNRVHRRVVMSSVGLKMINFRCLSELIGAFRDVISAHGAALEKGVLHRDISIGNIMLYDDGFGERKGLLIDFDHARLDDEHCEANPMNDDDEEEMQVTGHPQQALERTGTAPFISIAVLMRRKQHEGCHDLESIFYSLIYALTIFKGPGVMRLEADYKTLSSMPPVLEWFNLQEMDHSFNAMARRKMGHLCDFDVSIVGKMDSYFQSLAPFLQNLLDAFFPNSKFLDNKMTHSKMIELFDGEYTRLKAYEDVTMQKGKRKRMISNMVVDP